MARATQRLTFLSATLRELVDADDVPALAQGGYPFQVWGTAAESVGEVNHLVNAALSLTKLADGVRQIGR